MRLPVFLLSLTILVGCSNKNNAPKGIIPKEVMEKILSDIVQADQYSQLYLKKDSAKKNVKIATMEMYEEIFQIHHVSKDQFQASFQYYLGHPNITKVMLDTISARANRQKMEAFKRNTPKTKPK